MKKLILGALVVVTFTLTGCQIIGHKNNDSETNVTQNRITNNWVIYEDSGENYILLNTKTNEKITDVYDEGNERFLSAQDAVDALNNKFNR